MPDCVLRDELRDQSIRDPLTGLCNRRHFLDSLWRQLALSRRQATRFGLVSFDVDRFKLFNDNHGHDAGDLVLREIGTWLTENLTDDETPCRYGGEEFMVIVPGATPEAALQLAERLREGISALRVRHLRDLLPPVTVSCGVVGFPDHGADAGQLLRQVDAALYAAKHAGRNRVCLADRPQALLG